MKVNNNNWVCDDEKFILGDYIIGDDLDDFIKENDLCVINETIDSFDLNFDNKNYTFTTVKWY